MRTNSPPVPSQVKIFLRLWLAPGPLASYGPATSTLRRYTPRRVSGILTPAGNGRSNGRRGVSSIAEMLLMNVTTTSRAPAFTGTRRFHDSSARLRARSFARTRTHRLLNLGDRRTRGLLRAGSRVPGPGAGGCVRWRPGTLGRCVSRAADTGQRVETNTLAVDADLEPLILGVERHALVQVACQPRPDLVLTVHREHIADQRASAGPERKPGRCASCDRSSVTRK